MEIVGDLGVSCTISGFPFGEKSYSSLLWKQSSVERWGSLVLVGMERERHSKVA